MRARQAVTRPAGGADGAHPDIAEDEMADHHTGGFLARHRDRALLMALGPPGDPADLTACWWRRLIRHNQVLAMLSLVPWGTTGVPDDASFSTIPERQLMNLWSANCLAR